MEEFIGGNYRFSTGRTLVQEPRLINADDKYADAIAQLLGAQPEVATDIAIVQPVAEVKSVTFEDGTITIDWSAEVLDFEATDQEKSLALAAILTTMGEFEEVEQVAFTVEGQTDGEIEGKDVEDFWGRVSLLGSPWDVLRGPKPSEDATEAVEATATE